ncbi:hypothetical protein B0H11DRAFT_697492 [Mycena galericulata]|nr:hypothetical protein B0H11DRAFT_697492 [Mycena galericulata]
MELFCRAGGVGWDGEGRGEFGAEWHPPNRLPPPRALVPRLPQGLRAPPQGARRRAVRCPARLLALQFSLYPQFHLFHPFLLLAHAQFLLAHAQTRLRLHLRPALPRLLPDAREHERGQTTRPRAGHLPRRAALFPFLPLHVVRCLRALMGLQRRRGHWRSGRAVGRRSHRAPAPPPCARVDARRCAAEDGGVCGACVVCGGIPGRRSDDRDRRDRRDSSEADTAIPMPPTPTPPHLLTCCTRRLPHVRAHDISRPSHPIAFILLRVLINTLYAVCCICCRAFMYRRFLCV